MATTLSDDEVRNALRTLPGWTINGKAIERQFQFHDFVQTMKFVNRIADAAEEAGHHPDIAISYNRATFSLTSHDSGGITQRDLKMAKKVNEIAG